MRKIVPSHTELPIKNQHHATHTAAEKLLARSNRHSVQLPVEHKLQPVGAASGATSASRPQALTEVPIRAEPLARCDRTRHWIKAATRLLFAVRLRGPRSPLSPHEKRLESRQALDDARIEAASVLNAVCRLLDRGHLPQDAIYQATDAVIAWLEALPS